MFQNNLDKELKKYSKVERLVFYLDITLALIIILYSSILIKSKLGQASLWFGITLLGVITLMRALKRWGPKD